ncbi:hypothetical protein UlMin_038388 [Ulmus minor]
MSSASSQSSSSSGSIGSGQGFTMASVPALQMLNHTLPIDNIIFANDFEDFIKGTSICPEKQLSSGEINPTFVAWRRHDRTILSWIYSSLTPGIMAQIIGHTSFHSAWGSMSMIDYIMKIKRAADSLVAIGEPISDQDEIMNLLGGLGADYNVVVTALNTRDDIISLEAVHSMLLSFENCLEQQSSVENVSGMTANLASSSNNRGGGRKRHQFLLQHRSRPRR